MTDYVTGAGCNRLRQASAGIRQMPGQQLAVTGKQKAVVPGKIVNGLEGSPAIKIVRRCTQNGLLRGQPATAQRGAVAGMSQPNGHIDTFFNESDMAIRERKIEIKFRMLLRQSQEDWLHP